MGLSEEWREALTDLDVVSSGGSTSLMVATNPCSSEIIHQLIGRGADLNIRNCRSITAVTMAAWNKNHEVVRILVKNDITVATFVVMAIALCIMQQISFQSISSTLFYGGANKELTTHKCDIHLFLLRRISGILR